MRNVSDRESYTLLVAVGAVCVLAFLLIRVPRADGSVLTADGPGYFSYLRSVIFDDDLDFRNEYTRLGYCGEGDTPTELVCQFPYIENPTSTGLLGNPFSVGPALLWAPFYLAGHVFSLLASGAGFQVSVDGYGYLYEFSLSVASAAYVTVGCILTYRVCRRYFSQCACLLAVVSLFLASSLLHYTVAAPYMSHGVSYFAVSLFLFLWHPPRSRTCTQWILLGLSVGVMTLVRWQNVLYLTVLAVEAVYFTMRTTGAGGRPSVIAKYGTGVSIVGITALAAFAPQMMAWRILYGSPIAVPQGSGFFDWLHPVLLQYLFSTWHGLYTWHPIILLATLGLCTLCRRDRIVVTALAIPLLLQWYLNSAATDWAWQTSFGARKFVSGIPLLALGMAALTESVTKRLRRGSLVMLGAVTALVGWNFLFELQFSLGYISYGDPLTWNELVLGKFRMMVEFIGRVVPLP